MEGVSAHLGLRCAHRSNLLPCFPVLEPLPCAYKKDEYLAKIREGRTKRQAFVLAVVRVPALSLATSAPHPTVGMRSLLPGAGTLPSSEFLGSI